MKLTVAICTWNRDRLLRQTLESLRRLEPPAGATWDVVVVDNNSTDRTAEVLRAAADGLPLTGVFEPNPGLANARNRAVATATGDWIVWIDDDVIVDPRWLATYADAIRRLPDVVLFGGYARVTFEKEPPAWFREALPLLAGIFGDQPRLEGPVSASDERFPFGVNMAVRADIQRRFSFDPRLGRREGVQLSHEDAELVRYVLAEGLPAHWLPEAFVDHVVAAERLTEEYLCRWYEGFGQTMVLLGATNRGSHRSFLGRPLWAWKQAVVHEALYRITRRTASPMRWVRHMSLARVARGYLTAPRSAPVR